MSTKTDVNRRTMIRGAGVLPAIAILPTAALAAGTIPPDPIFAAIAECRAAITAAQAASCAHTEMELNICNNLNAAGMVGNVAAVAARDPRYIAAGKEMDRCFDVADDAAWALLDVRPTTLIGAAALLRLASEDEDLLDDWVWPDHVENEVCNFHALLSQHVAEALELIGAGVSS